MEQKKLSDFNNEFVKFEESQNSIDFKNPKLLLIAFADFIQQDTGNINYTSTELVEKFLINY